MTTSGRLSSTSDSADQSANCAYASSATTRPFETAEQLVDPVGRFDETGGVVGRGEERDVRVVASDHPPHLGGVEREVGLTLALDHASTRRPGRSGRASGRSARRSPRSDLRPANVSRIVCRTSFEPLAANTMSGVTPCNAAIASRSSSAPGRGTGATRPATTRQRTHHARRTVAERVTRSCSVGPPRRPVASGSPRGHASRHGPESHGQATDRLDDAGNALRPNRLAG